MALIKCGECRKDVSTKAKTCPNCGAKRRHFKRQPDRFTKFVPFIGGFFVLLVVLTATGIIGPDAERKANQIEVPKEVSSALFEMSGPQSINASWICAAAMSSAMKIPLNSINQVETDDLPTMEFTTVRGELETSSCKLDGNKILWKPIDAESWTKASESTALRYYRNQKEILVIAESDAGSKSYHYYSASELGGWAAGVSEVDVETVKASGTKEQINHSNAVFDRKVCKAAIAAIFSQSPSIISVTGETPPLEVRYTRPVDNKKWRYRCRIEGDNVLWAGWTNGNWGRWRNGEYDAEITFERSDDQLKITETYPGSSGSTKSYSISAL